MKPNLILNECKKDNAVKEPSLDSKKQEATVMEIGLNKSKRASSALLNCKEDKRSRPQQCESMHENSEEEKEEDEDDRTELLFAELASFSKCEEDTTEESLLDPETGLILIPRTKTSACLQESTEMVPFSPNTSAKQIDIEYNVLHSSKKKHELEEMKHSKEEVKTLERETLENRYDEDCQTDEDGK